MITVLLDEKQKKPLYEQLYRALRVQIEAGELPAGGRLPSKRKMADHLRVSMRTVENAYAQLEVEGYLEALEKRGYFVRKVEVLPHKPPPPQAAGKAPSRRKPTGGIRFDMTTEGMYIRHFPFSVWTKLMRESLRFEAEALLQPIHPQGDPDLRAAIARHLREFRNMAVDAEQVVLGAGTEYLLGLVAELLRGSVFALENPNFHKWAKILASRQTAYQAISMDDEGISLDEVRRSKASVVLATPSHHFPLGTVMTIGRRTSLLHWAAARQDRYLIEDDYDTEYRYALRPIPALHSLDRNDTVIYMNTFTRTLAPSLRVAYMVLPPLLLERYRQELHFYSSTVSAFEQGILHRFLDGGHYERHLNRIRTVYKNRRDAFLDALEPLSGEVDIHGYEAGLHLLATARGNVREQDLVDRAKRKGVGVYELSGYYLVDPPETRTVVLGYGGYDADTLREIARHLIKAWKGIGTK